MGVVLYEILFNPQKTMKKALGHSSQITRERTINFFEGIGFHIEQWINQRYIPKDDDGLVQGDVLIKIKGMGVALQAAATAGLIKMSAIDFFLWRVSEKHSSMESMGESIHMRALFTQIFTNKGGRYKDEILHTVHQAGKMIRDAPQSDAGPAPLRVTPIKRSVSHLGSGAQDSGEPSRSRAGFTYVRGFPVVPG